MRTILIAVFACTLGGCATEKTARPSSAPARQRAPACGADCDRQRQREIQRLAALGLGLPALTDADRPQDAKR